MDHWKLSGVSQPIPHKGHSSSSFLAPVVTPTSIASTQQTYAQQTYAQQQATSAYTSNHAGESQHSVIQQSTLWGSSTRDGQQADPSSFSNLSRGVSIVGGTSGIATSLNQYGGQHGGVYGISSSNNSQQPKEASQGGAISNFQGSTSGVGQGGGSFGGGLPSVDASAVYGLKSAKFIPGGTAVGFGGAKAIDYGSSSSHGYSMKSDQYPVGYNVKNSEYTSLEREQYSKGHGAYIGGDLRSDLARRYLDAVGIGQSRQPELGDQALLLRQQQVLQAQQLRSSEALREDQLLHQQQLLQAQQLQSGTTIRQSVPHIASDGEMRLTEYLPRSNAMRSGSQDHAAPARDVLSSSYGVSMVDANPGLLAFRTGSASYPGQQPGSVVGHIEGRNLGGSMYRQGSLNTTYGGVGLPPGRDYNAAKGTGGGHNDEHGDGRSLLGHEYDRRGDDLSAEHHQERERDWQQRQRDRERERERKQEREREHERERKQERERKRLKEIEEKLQQKKREYELRREIAAIRAATAPRVYNFCSLPGRESRLTRRESPHHELHRERRREYICKIQSHSLVEVERGFLSVSKRYKKLHVAPDFSKLVTHWLEEPDLFLGKPISFERDAIEVEDKTNSEVPSSKSSRKAAGTKKAPKGSTVWNSKVILMSGIGEDALADLVSERNPSDKIVHMHNVIKFAVFRKDRAILAAGGPWDKVLDGGDPAKDEGALVRTAIRIMKETAQLDLTGCQKWKRFVEFHYHRAGEDGLPSYKEISVFFIPDLSPCLPSFERWKIQWNEQRQAKLEREQLEAASKEKDEKVNVKNASKDKENSVANEEISEKDGKKENKESDGAEEHEDDSGDKGNDNDTEKTVGKDATKMKAGKGAKVLEVDDKGKDVKNEENEGKEGKETEDDYEDAKKGMQDVKVEEKKVEGAGGITETKENEKAGKKRKKKGGKKKFLKMEKIKQMGEKKDKDCKDTTETEGHVSKESMDEVKSDELPPYPGFFLASKQSKDPKMRPMSISLEGLLDYNEKDTDESTFELSLFAEVFQEMLQYQLGSCILASLEALRKSVGAKKREGQKRTRDDKTEKEKLVDIVPKQKRSKFSDKPTVDEKADDKSAKVEIAEENALAIDESAPINDALPINHRTLVVDSSSDEEAVKDEQIADVEMKDASQTKGQVQEERTEDLKVEKVEKPANVAKKIVIDKDLLKAYCYFDQNRVGYIKAEDLRRLLHALGKFISNRDVKKLVVCALRESNKPCEGRIIYQPLVEHEVDT